MTREQTSCDGAARGPIKIGVIADLSGPFAPFGESLDRSVRLAAKEINTAGGVDGRDLAVRTVDAQSDVDAAVAAAHELLVSHDVDLLVGPISSTANDGVSAAASRARKLQFYTEHYEGGHRFPHYFSFGPVPSQFLEPLVSLARDRSQKKALLYGADYVGPQRVLAIAEELITKAGGSTSEPVMLPLVTTDFSVLVGAVDARRPDYVIGAYPAAFAASVMALRHAGVPDMVTIMNATSCDIDIMALGALGKGVVTSLQYSSAIPTDAATRFLTAFQAEYGNDALPGAGESVGAYNSLFMYKSAVERAGTTAPDDVAEAMVGQNYDGPTGLMTMTDSHHVSQMMTVVESDGSKNLFVSTSGPLDPSQTACGQLSAWKEGAL